MLRVVHLGAQEYFYVILPCVSVFRFMLRRDSRSASREHSQLQGVQDVGAEYCQLFVFLSLGAVNPSAQLWALKYELLVGSCFSRDHC